MIDIEHNPRCRACNGKTTEDCGIGRYKCISPNCNGSAVVKLTAHAADQWSERCSEPEKYNAVTCYQEGTILHEMHDLDAHDVRYHHDSRMVLLRKNENIVTVISILDSRQSIRNAAICTCLRDLKNPDAAGEICKQYNIEIEEFRQITEPIRPARSDPAE